MFTEHAKLVAALAKPHLIHMAVGVSGEAGELLNAIKKRVIYRKPLDRQNVIEELGDIEFYLEGLRQSLEISREETIEQNMVKLQKRFSGAKYSDAAAQARADKVDANGGGEAG